MTHGYSLVRDAELFACTDIFASEDDEAVAISKTASGGQDENSQWPLWVIVVHIRLGDGKVRITRMVLEISGKVDLS